MDAWAWLLQPPREGGGTHLEVVFALFRFSSDKRVAFTDYKNEAKEGVHYELTSRVVDPPSYMRVTSKIQYSPSKSMGASGFSRN